MPDGSILREFLIPIKYALDEASQKRFTTGVGAADTRVAGMQKSLTAATQALNRLALQFKETAGEPTRKYEDSARRVGASQDLISKKFKDFRLLVVAGATAVAAGVAKVAREYETLFYTVQRTGTRAEAFGGFGFSSKQVGLQADTVKKILNDLSSTLKTNPGMRQALMALSGGGDIAGALDPSKSANQQGEALYDWLDKISNLPAPRLDVLADQLGTTFETLQQLIANRGDARKAFEEQIALQQRFGVDLTKLTEISRDFERAWNSALSALEVGWQKAAIVLEPILTGWLRDLRAFIDKIGSGEMGFDEAGRRIVKTLGDALRAAFEFIGGQPEWREFGSKIANDLVQGIQAGLEEQMRGLWSGLVDQITNDPDLKRLKELFETIFGAPGRVHDWAVGKLSAPSAPGEPPSVGPPAPQFQHGGMVRADLHHGEAVLPAFLTQFLLRAAQGGGGGDRGMVTILQQIYDGLQGWWLGSSNYRPYVVVQKEGFGAEEAVGGPRHGDPFGLNSPRAGAGKGIGGGTVGPLNPPFGPSGRATAAKFINYLVGLGVDIPHAQGMVANALAESSFNPNATGAAGERGMFQWDRSRWANAGKSLGDRLSDPFAQLNFAVEEMKKRVPNWFSTPMGAADATRSWEHLFERPQHETGRLNYLQQIQGDRGGGGTTVNQTNHVTINTNQHEVGRRLALVHERIAGDTLRGMQTKLS